MNTRIPEPGTRHPEPFASPETGTPNPETFLFPTPDAPQTSFRGNVFALINTNRRNGASISAETCIPQWDGEPMDSDMAIVKLVELGNSN